MWFTIFRRYGTFRRTSHIIIAEVEVASKTWHTFLVTLGQLLDPMHQLHEQRRSHCRTNPYSTEKQKVKKLSKCLCSN